MNCIHFSFYEGSPRVKSPVAVYCYGGLVIFYPFSYPSTQPGMLESAQR